MAGSRLKSSKNGWKVASRTDRKRVSHRQNEASAVNGNIYLNILLHRINAILIVKMEYQRNHLVVE